MIGQRFSKLLVPLLLLSCAYLAGYVTHAFLPLVPTLSQPAPSGEDWRVFWQAWGYLEKDFYGEKPATTQRVYGATHGMVRSYGDPFTVFVEPQPQELQSQELEGKFGGIGARIEKTEVGFLLHPVKEQPAALAGIQDGDQLLKVDEVEITLEMSSDEVVAHVRGKVDTAVALVVGRLVTPSLSTMLTETATVSASLQLTTGLAITASNPLLATNHEHLGEREPLTIIVTRKEIQLPSIDWDLIEAASAQPGVKPQRIGYIRHTLFSERSPQEMRDALDALRGQGAERFIWDLRGNPGGLVKSAVELLDIWLADGVVLREIYSDGTKQTYEAQAGGEAVDAPLVVLVDGGSASASEIVAGALKDRGRAQLVGGKTFGKGSVQLIHTLLDGSSLHVTYAQWFTPDNHQITGNGLEPDIVLENGADPLPVAVDLLVAQPISGTSQSAIRTVSQVAQAQFNDERPRNISRNISHYITRNIRV